MPSDAGQKPQETQRYSLHELLQIVVTILAIVVTLGQRKLALNHKKLTCADLVKEVIEL